MKFLNIGLVALSSLFATSYAAPAVHGLPTDLDIPKVPAVHAPVIPETEILDKRAEVVYTKVQYTIVEVKKHCSAINSTVDGVTGGQVTQKKAAIIQLVKAEVTIIAGLIHSLVSDVVEALGESVEIVEEEKEKITSTVLELVFEILYSLNYVIKALGISIFELLGPLVFVLLTVVFHLLCTLNGLIDGLLELVLSVLGGVIGLLFEVLKGLLPIILGVVGGILNKLDLGGLLCSIL